MSLISITAGFYKFCDEHNCQLLKEYPTICAYW